MLKKIGAACLGLGAMTYGAMVQAAIAIDDSAVKANIDAGEASASSIASYAITALCIVIVVGIIVAVVKKV